jgi:hypothetical protein
LSSFQFAFNIPTSNFGFGPSTFSYNLSNLNQFALDFRLPNESIFSTAFVGGSNPRVPAEAFLKVDGFGSSAAISMPQTSNGNVSIDKTSLAAAIVKGAVTLEAVGPYSTSHQPTNMTATFTPNFGLSTQQAATLLGYKGFNWTQQVEIFPNPHPPGWPLTTPFDDSYLGWGKPGVYLSPAELETADNGTNLYFSDQPRNSCLFGGSGIACSGRTNPTPGVFMEFETDLVGVLNDGSVGPSLAKFVWTSTYAGDDTHDAPGGIQFAGSIDSGNGYGGVTILSETYPLSQAPLPAALPLFATGLGALGLLGWRRKQERERSLDQQTRARRVIRVRGTPHARYS